MRRFDSRIELPNDRADSFIRAIEQNANLQMDLVCCILTNDRKDRYDAIKKVLCGLFGPIPSTFSATISQSNLSIFSHLDALVANITKTRSTDVRSDQSRYSNQCKIRW